MADFKESFRDLCIALYVAQIFYTPLFILAGFILLLFTRFWFLTLIYFVWFALDRNTPKRGGRFSQWFVDLKIWEFMRHYFPLEVIREAELPSNRNYMFGLHPHGVYNLTFFLEALYHQTTFKHLFPGIQIKPLALDSALSLPLHREFLMAIGFTSISKQGFDYWFKKYTRGIALKFSVGGLDEVLDARPNTMILTLNKRKGFIKLALVHGVSLVPVIQFGENEIFSADERFKGLQKFLIKTFGIYIPICSGRWFNMPRKQPIYTVVGSPIHVDQVKEPTGEQIDALHQKYVQEVQQLFERHSHLAPKNVALKIK